MVNAVIFDMDGLLLDSEDFWQHSEFTQFSALGVPLTLADTKKTVGWRCDYVVRYWYEQAPWQGPTQGEVADAIIDGVIAQIKSKGRLLPGAQHAIELCKQLGLPVALATSSNHRMMRETLRHFGLLSLFDATCSAEFLPYAKPHPQVYMDCAASLNVNPLRCICFEDSFNGMIAAKAAKMKCVVVPAAAQLQQARWGAADLKISSLQNFNDLLLRQLQ